MAEFQEPPEDNGKEPAAYVAKAPASKFLFNPDKPVLTVTGMTLSGGEMHSTHHQKGPHHLNEKHEMWTLKVDTKEFGTLAGYSLSPNSVGNQTYGAGYVTPPVKFEAAGIKAEATGMLGLVTGYATPLLPTAAVNLRVGFLEKKIDGGTLSVGVEASAMPYASYRNQPDGSRKYTAGIVTTSPLLSLRYVFNDRAEVKAPRPALDETAAQKAAVKPRTLTP